MLVWELDRHVQLQLAFAIGIAIDIIISVRAWVCTNHTRTQIFMVCIHLQSLNSSIPQRARHEATCRWLPSNQALRNLLMTSLTWSAITTREPRYLHQSVAGYLAICINEDRYKAYLLLLHAPSNSSNAHQTSSLPRCYKRQCTTFPFPHHSNG